jgi:uncharacterized protein (TIGR03083 family)
MAEMAAAYRDSRTGVQELVRDLDRATLDKQVPACPDWTVKDLVAHLCGVASDSIGGNVSDLGGAEWTASQVTARKDRSVAELIEEWTKLGEQIEAGLDDLHPTLASALIGDAVTHEHDLRGAIGEPGARDSEGVVISTSFYARNFGKRLKDAGLPTLIVQGGEHEWTAGREEPIGTVRAPLFEMLRGLTGRRTLDEVKGFDWSIEAAPYLDIFSMYPVTQTSHNE